MVLFFTACLVSSGAAKTAEKNRQPAQGVSLNNKGKDGRPVPVELIADGGLEWDRNKMTMTARKKATVTRDDMTLAADLLTAYYREKGKDIDVYKITAKGHVLITSPKQTIYAETADFFLPESLVVLRGSPVTLVAGDEKMTSKVLKYWRDGNFAEASDHVVAVKGDRRLQADTVKAFFAEKNSKMDIDRFEASDNVVITNDKENVSGDFGVYYVQKETATLHGNVKIAQGENYITGEVVDVNMVTGVSRLQTPEDDGRPKGKVRGVFLPETKKKSKTKDKADEKPVKNTEKPTESELKPNEKILGTTSKAD